MEGNYYGRIIKLAIPAFLANVQQGFFELLTMFFLSSNVGSSQLAAYGLTNVIVSFISAIFIGLNTTLLTLVSQSFGRGDLELCRTYINRGRVIVSLAFIPIALLL